MSARDEALRRLKSDWGGLYEITEALGVWRAVRLSTGWTIVATGPAELRTLIARDHGINGPAGEGQAVR